MYCQPYRWRRLPEPAASRPIHHVDTPHPASSAHRDRHRRPPVGGPRHSAHRAVQDPHTWRDATIAVVKVGMGPFCPYRQSAPRPASAVDSAPKDRPVWSYWRGRLRHVAVDATGCRIRWWKVEEALQQLERQREHDRRVLFSGDLGQRLQVPQLQGRGLTADDLSGVGELLAGTELTLCMDNLGPLGQQVVEVRLAKNASQRGLANQGRSADVVEDLDDGVFGIHDAEVDHRIYFDRDVVAGDRLLSGNFEGHDAQVYFAHTLDAWDEKEQARPACPDEAAQAEDDPALILLNDFYGRAQHQEPEHQDGD